MGGGPRFSDGRVGTAIPHNPNPLKFKITRLEKIGKFLIAMINYPDCTTYRGNKVLVYEGIHEEFIKDSTSLDPHLLENSESPIARFRGNKEGWVDAMMFVSSKVKMHYFDEKGNYVAEGIPCEE